MECDADTMTNDDRNSTSDYSTLKNGVNHIGKYQLLSPTYKRAAAGSQVPKYAIRCALLASLNSILLGYDIGVISGAVLFIKDDLKIGEWQEELLVGSLNIVSLFGAAISGRVADAVGRRWTMAVAALFFFVGAMVMGLAPGFGVLMGGRVLAGIGVGFALMIAPVYTAEVSPSSNRGSLVSLPEIFINVGILLGYVSSYVLSAAPAALGWRLMLGFGVLPAILLACGALVMPESPRWLVLQNRIEEAELVLVRTSGDKAEAEQRLSEIIYAAGGTNRSDGQVPESSWFGQIHETETVTKSQGGEGVWREIFWPTPTVRRILTIALGIQFFQQASGVDATVYYSPEIFYGAGISSKSGSIGATVAVGISKTVFILVATIWLDRVGRRPLLLASSLGMTASLAVLGLGFKLLDVTRISEIDALGGGSPVSAAQDDISMAPSLAVAAICAYVAFFSIGMGPICWVLTSEILPLRLRAQAMGLGIVVNRVASGTVALTFLSLSRAITLSGTFCIFAAVGVLATIFIYYAVPETKGKNLEEIAKLFDIPSSGSIEMGTAVSSGNVAASHSDSTSRVQLSPIEAEDEEDLTLIEHDILVTAGDKVAARRQLLAKVKSIAKMQGSGLSG